MRRTPQRQVHQQEHRRPLQKRRRRRLVHPRSIRPPPRRHRLRLLRPQRVPQRDGHPRRLVRIRSKLARRPRPRARTPLPRRPLHRRRRPASRLVPLLAPHLSRRPQPGPLQDGRHLRLDPRRTRPRLLQIPRQRRRSRRHRQAPRRRDHPPLGSLRRLPRRRRRQRKPHAARQRQLPQAAQHPPLPPRQPQRLRPCHQRRRAFAQMEPLDQYILARTAELDAKIRAGLRRLRVPPRLPRPQRVREHRPQRALPRRPQRPPLHLRPQPPRPPQRADRALAHRRSPHPPHRPHPQLHRRRGLAAPAQSRRPRLQRPPRSLPRHRRHRPRQRQADRRRLGAPPHPPRRGPQSPRRSAHRQRDRQPSLEVAVTVGWLNSIACHPNPIFERYHSILPELFGVAQVHIADAIVTEGTVEKGAFYVQAKPAKGTKCERCWRFTDRRRQRSKLPHRLPALRRRPRSHSLRRPTPHHPAPTEPQA